MRGNGRVGKDDQYRRRAVERMCVGVAEDGSVHALKLRDRFRVLHDDDLYRLSAHAGGCPGARARDGAELLGQDLSFFIAAAASARFDCL